MDNQTQNYGEMERIIAKRDREKYLEELSELENNLASTHSKIFYAAISLLIIEPLVTFAAGWYFWDQVKTAWGAGAAILNLGSNIKYSAIAIAGSFTLTSLTLLFYLWRVSSLQSQIAKLRGKISRLERRL